MLFRFYNLKYLTRMSPLKPDHQSKASDAFSRPLCVIIHILYPSSNTVLSMIITYFCPLHLDETSWAESTLHWIFPWPMSSNQINMTSHWIFFMWKKPQSYFSLPIPCDGSLLLTAERFCLTQWGYTCNEGRTQTSNHLEFLLPAIYEHLLWRQVYHKNSRMLVK